MWSEASAKMAAWVWGEDLAGAWTPFFAGEGDTLSVKINAEADSIIFVRFNSAVAAPTWDEPGTNIWNRVKDDKIDHVGLTYTITAWGDEGISVGQWTPYEPVVPGKYYITGDSALVVDAGLTADKAWNPAAIKADADTTVLNLKAGVDYKLKVTVDGTWATALGFDALSEKAEGLSADADGNICFKLAEAGAVQVVYFKEGEKVTYKLIGNFYVKPATYYMKNNWGAGEDWTWKEMTPDNAGSYKLEKVVYGGTGVNYNTAESDEGATWVAEADIKGDKLAAKDTVNLVLNPVAGTVTATIVGKYQPSGETKYYMKNNWNAGADWTWKEMTPDNAGLYMLANVVYGGTGVNYNTEEVDATATWVAEADILGDKLAAKDTVNLVLNPTAGTVTATIVGKYVPSGDTKYYMKNNWDAAADWTWKEMTKDGDNYKLENVVFGGGGVNYNTEAVDAGATWVEVADFLGDEIGAKDTVNFVLNPTAGTVTAKLIGKYQPSGCEGKFGIKVGETIIEFAKNESQTQWTEYYKQGVTLTQGQVFTLYDICAEVAFTATISGYEGFTPTTGGWTVTETGVYDFYLKLIEGADELYVDKQGPAPDPTVEVWGSMNNWSVGLPLTLSADKTTATITANIEADSYDFKIRVNGEWRSNAQTFTRQNNSATGITMNEDANMIFVADMNGNYTVTWTLATSALSIVYPTTPTAVENLMAPANEMRKVMLNGTLYILRDGKVYNVQGQLIR